MINLGLEKYVLGNMRRGSLIIFPFKVGQTEETILLCLSLSSGLCPYWKTSSQFQHMYCFVFWFQLFAAQAFCNEGDSEVHCQLIQLVQRKAVSLRHSAGDSISIFTFSILLIILPIFIRLSCIFNMKTHYTPAKFFLLCFNVYRF